MKPVYRYEIHEPDEAAGDGEIRTMEMRPTDVRAITVYGPDGKELGKTQMWNGVTAKEMVTDWVHLMTELDLGSFLVEEKPPYDDECKWLVQSKTPGDTWTVMSLPSDRDKAKQMLRQGRTVEPDKKWRAVRETRSYQVEDW